MQQIFPEHAIVDSSDESDVPDVDDDATIIDSDATIIDSDNTDMEIETTTNSPSLYPDLSEMQNLP